MSILPDHILRNRGEELVLPFHQEMVQPASIDLRLDDKFYVFKELNTLSLERRTIRPNVNNDHLCEKIELDDKHSLVIEPGEFLLGATYEWINIPRDLVARFEGKSSLGRLGLLVHATAGFIDPGFSGHITVEIKNLTKYSWELIPGMKIGQICFETLESPVKKAYGDVDTYGSKYQGQSGPTLSKYYLNYNNDIAKEN